jgi:hypothetical protein
MCTVCASHAEILRDYGFIESFPRVFHYEDTDMQFDLDITQNGTFGLRWRRLPKRDDRSAYIVWLKRQIRRLQQVKNINFYEGNPGIPENEWNLAWEFQKANIEAMTVAAASLEAIERGDASAKIMTTMLTNVTRKDFVDDKPHYDPLQWEFDDLDYVKPTCHNRDIMKFFDHVNVETLKTHYQTLNFMIHPETRDVVMDLDDIVQVGPPLVAQGNLSIPVADTHTQLSLCFLCSRSRFLVITDPNTTNM